MKRGKHTRAVNGHGSDRLSQHDENNKSNGDNDSLNLKTDVKTFWRYVNNGMKVRVPVGDLEREDGTVATTDTENAEVLNQFFTSVLP